MDIVTGENIDNLESLFNSMDLGELQKINNNYRRIAELSGKVFDNRYKYELSQGFPQYDYLPKDIKKEILQRVDPRALQLVSKESKQLTDRFMSKFCDGVRFPTESEIKNYISNRPLTFFNFDDTGGGEMKSGNMRLGNESYKIKLEHNPYDRFYIIKITENSFYFGNYYDPSERGIFSPQAYYNIFSQRDPCMTKDHMYALTMTKSIFAELLSNKKKWKIITAALYVLTLDIPDLKREIAAGNYYELRVSLAKIRDEMLERINMLAEYTEVFHG